QLVESFKLAWLSVEKRPVSAASPEVGKDDHTCDRRVRTPQRGERASRLVSPARITPNIAERKAFFISRRCFRSLPTHSQRTRMSGAPATASIGMSQRSYVGLTTRTTP